MQDMLQRNEFLRPARAALSLAQLVAPGNDPAIKSRILADQMIDPLASFHQAGQDFVEVGVGKRIVHAE